MFFGSCFKGLPDNIHHKTNPATLNPDPNPNYLKYAWKSTGRGLLKPEKFRSVGRLYDDIKKGSKQGTNLS